MRFDSSQIHLFNKRRIKMNAKGIIKTKREIKHTGHLWGPVSDIEDKCLEVLDVSYNEQSYLCMNSKKTGLVDVDIRDVVTFTKAPADTSEGLIHLMASIMGAKYNQDIKENR